MGQNLSLMHLPAQSGKTRRMIELINHWNAPPHTTSVETKPINIVFVDNNLLLALQTHRRFVDGITSEEGTTSREPRIFAWTSEPPATPRSGKSVRTTEASAVFDEIIYHDRYDTVVCCLNKIRVTKVLELIDRLHKFRSRGHTRNVNIWIDEADHHISVLNEHDRSLNEYGDFITNIILITATMEPIYQHLERFGHDCRVRVYKHTYPPTYHKYAESEIVHPDCALFRPIGGTSREISGGGFETLLYICKSVEIPQTSRWLCPGYRSVNSHEEISAVLLRRGFNVLILNGTTKEIRYADSRPSLQLSKKIRKDLEIATTINRIYFTTDLCRAPFAVTGNICISRGITFASRGDIGDFMFTHAVIPDDYSSGKDAYQLVSRCIGNIKDMRGYTPPVIYVSEGLHMQILVQEIAACEIARILWERVNDPKAYDSDHEDEDEEEEPVLFTHEERRKYYSDLRKKLEGNAGGPPGYHPAGVTPKYVVVHTQGHVRVACKAMNYNGSCDEPGHVSVTGYNPIHPSLNGLYEVSIDGSPKKSWTLEEAISLVPRAYSVNHSEKHHRIAIPCYKDHIRKERRRFVFIIRPEDVSDITRLERLTRKLSEYDEMIKQKKYTPK